MSFVQCLQESDVDGVGFRFSRARYDAFGAAFGCGSQVDDGVQSVAYGLQHGFVRHEEGHDVVVHVHFDFVDGSGSVQMFHKDFAIGVYASFHDDEFGFLSVVLCGVCFDAPAQVSHAADAHEPLEHEGVLLWVVVVHGEDGVVTEDGGSPFVHGFLHDEYAASALSLDGAQQRAFAAADVAFQGDEAHYGDKIGSFRERRRMRVFILFFVFRFDDLRLDSQSCVCVVLEQTF